MKIIPAAIRASLRGTLGDLRARRHRRSAVGSKDLVLPDFLGIGAQKAGTTWLYDNLRCHPEIFLSSTKELHYFDRFLHKNIRSYADNFAGVRQMFKGEITPSYSALSPARIQYVHYLMPKARLIFLMRNPIDRAWSQALMNLVVKTKRKFEDIDEKEFFDHFADKRSISRGDYRSTVNNWLKAYTEDQLYIGTLNEIRARPKETLLDVIRHIGASTDVDLARFPYNQVAHKGVGIVMPEKYRSYLHDIYRDEIERLIERFGPRLAHWRT